MKKYSAIALVSLAALALASCNRQPEEPVSIEPASVPEETATTSLEEPSADEAIRTQVFQTAEGVVVTEADSEVQIPGLIPSTDPTLRAKAVGKGRQDPFSGRVILVRPLLPEPATVDDPGFTASGLTAPSAQTFNTGTGEASRGTATGTRSTSSGNSASERNSGRSVSAPSRAATPSTPSTPSASSSASRPARASSNTPRPQQTASRPSSGGGSSSAGSSSRSTSNTASQPSRASSSSSSTASGSNSSPSGGTAVAAAPADIPDLTPRPPIPDPSTARAVEVTGVVQIGSSYQAIVKAPDEPTSRYVSVGQRLSNGRVLVKRIESNGSEPVVILEEGGVEVVRAIGAPSSEADEASA